MARCRCIEPTDCSCRILPGEGVAISGTGTSANPMIISSPARASGAIAVEDTPSLDLLMIGSGVQGDPFIISGHVNVDTLINTQDSSTIDFVVTGTGTAIDPFMLSGAINVSPALQFADTPNVDFTTTGLGVAADPLIVTATVPWAGDMTAGATGDVLTKQLDGTWAPAPPNTVTPGVINTGFGMTGDGSGGSPLRINVCTYDDLRLACAPP